MTEEKDTCYYCGYDLCVFIQFEGEIANLGRWHQRAQLLETNRERRKHAFSTFPRWYARVGGCRKKLYQLVEIGVRSWYPDKAYIGFWVDEDRSARRRAVDKNG